MKKRTWYLTRRMMAVVLAATVAAGYTESGFCVQAASDYFSMVETGVTLMVGETDFIEIELAPDIDYTERDLKWKSSDSSIVTVDEEGVVTGVSEGTAVITAAMPDGSSQDCTVTISGYMNEEEDPDRNIDESTTDGDYDETPDFTGLTIPKQMEIFVKEEAFMELSYEPEDADEETITWKSSNPKVATVDESGKVTGIKTGTVRIIAMTPNDITATCTITIKKPQIVLKKSEAKIKVGKRVQIKATCSPDTKPTFKSQNKAVATVTAKGLVKARKKGKTVIVVKANGVSKKFNVTVLR